jgi:hypothetical protein
MWHVFFAGEAAVTMLRQLLYDLNMFEFLK